MTARPLPVPAQVLEAHIAGLGMTGAGKTSKAKLLVEHLADRGDRVCILDPIKSDWWGLTSSADGRTAGLPFAILGGPHGHLPLSADAGAALARVVADGALPLSIFDMRRFPAGGHARFFAAFAETLLEHMRGVLYLVMEEAHIFAPKERAGFAGENFSVHWAKVLATAGRSAGVRLMVLTQRTQALHNAVLGSCETLIVSRLMAPADQAPAVKWLNANAPKGVAAEVAGQLGALERPEAWVCSGELKVFERVTWPLFRTWDNSATPTRESQPLNDRGRVRTAAVDVAALRQVVGDAAAAAAADPAALRARIAELEQGAPAAAHVAIEADFTAAVQAAEERGRVEGFALGYVSGYGGGWGSALHAAEDGFKALINAPARRPTPKSIETSYSLLEVARLGADVASPTQRASTERVEDPGATQRTASPGMAARLLEAARRSPVHALALNDVCILAGVSPISGPARIAKAWLVQQAGEVSLDPVSSRIQAFNWRGDGPERLTRDEVVDAWRAKLGGMAAEILGFLFVHGGGTREAAAQDLGRSPVSGPWRGAWKKLRTNQLVEECEAKRWRLAAILRELPKAVELAA